MSKAKAGASAMRNLRKQGPKVDHGNKLKTNIPAGMAAAGPPLGPQLGQHGLNIAAFCKDFNEKTKHIVEGIPLPTRVTINPDRSYKLQISQPPATFLMKQAAGIQRGAMQPGKEIAGRITLKHLYEIAKIKSTDASLECVSLQEICQRLVGVARSVGIEVVKDLDPTEYQAFLEERKVIVEEQKLELQEKKEAKMLRTSAA